MKRLLNNQTEPTDGKRPPSSRFIVDQAMEESKSLRRNTRERNRQRAGWRNMRWLKQDAEAQADC